MSITEYSEKLRNYCQANGKKNTPERYEVLSVLGKISTRDFHADDILEEARHQDYYFSRATIYRTLELFEVAGIIIRVRKKNGKQLYTLSKDCSHNSYFHCLRCEKKIQINTLSMKDIVNKLNNQYHFAGINQTVIIDGYCDECNCKRAGMGNEKLEELATAELVNSD